MPTRNLVAVLVFAVVVVLLSFAYRRLAPAPPARDYTGDICEAVERGDLAQVQKIVAASPASVSAETLATVLHEAVLRRHKAMVEFLLAKGAEVNAKNSVGQTPLHIAAYNASISGGAHKDIVELLLANGADINARDQEGQTPLHCTFSRAVAELLLAKGAHINAKDNKGTTPLHHLAWDTPEALEFLLNNGANINARNDEGQTPLHRVAEGGRTDTAKLLLARGADINAKDDKGMTALNLARNEKMVELLRQRGEQAAKANTPSRKPPTQDAASLAPQIIEAAARGDLEKIKAILKNNPELLNTKKGNAFGSTPLHFAAYNGRTEVAQYLLSTGADVNAINNAGVTPLHDATATGRLDIVLLLLTKKADVTIRDGRGKTALDYAIEKQHQDIAEVLRQHRGKP